MCAQSETELSFLGKSLPPGYGRRVVSVAPGCRHLSHEDEWRDAVLVVECGEIELECSGEVCIRLRQGAVLWLTGLRLRALRNPGPTPTVLVAVWRRKCP